MSRLDDKVAVVTGAGSGIGRAMAVRFADEGARVVAVDLSGREDETARARSAQILPFHGDVAVEEDVRRAIECAVAEFGGLDIIGNVAGIGIPSKLVDLQLDDYDRVLDVDLRGVVVGMKHAVPEIAKRGGGSIINIASVAGLAASDRGTTAYSAAKFGVVGVTKVAAIEAGPLNVRVNAICPGIILSEMGQGAVENFGNELLRKACLQRAGRPEEVAALAAFLASDEASFISGAAITIDGGWSARLA